MLNECNTCGPWGSPDRAPDIRVLQGLGINSLAAPRSYVRAYRQLLPEVSETGWWEFRHRLHDSERLNWLVEHLVVRRDQGAAWWQQTWDEAAVRAQAPKRSELGRTARRVLVSRLAEDDELLEALIAAMEAELRA